MAPKKAKTELSSVAMDKDRYLTLLGKLLGESESLQNDPPNGLIPREDNASQHVLEVLKPYTEENGGPLKLERVAFTPGRSNVIIVYPGQGPESIAFVGSHMDLVPANPETWKRDPFKMTIEGDEIHGRGATDCLGHVAMVTELMLELAIKKPKLQRTVTAVFIANEENQSVKDIGVDRLMATGKMDHLKNGPVIWVDCSDSQPCIGTASSIVWFLKANGKLFHSGLPHKGVNAIELANAAVRELQDRFYKEFPTSVKERDVYKFTSCSTMKPTQVKCAVGALNQLPPWCEIHGDVRLTPFYEAEACKAKLTEWVAELNANLDGLLSSPGPVAKYEIEGFKGSLELTFGESHLDGIACSTDSPGYHALCAATAAVLGEAKPYSICGSLPLVRDLQRKGFDLQMTGYGLMKTYHADNEYCLLSDMQNGFKILLGVIGEMEGK